MDNSMLAFGAARGAAQGAAARTETIGLKPKRTVYISYLADRPEFISVLAPPIFNHWHSALKNETLDSRISKLHAHLNKKALPIAWVAHDDDEVFGTAALRLSDLDGSENLSPWLGGVFVLPAHRRRGVASALSLFVEQQAWLRGYENLYLFTPDQQTLYGKLGWVESKKIVWHSLESSIMVKNRNDAQQSAPADKQPGSLAAPCPRSCQGTA